VSDLLAAFLAVLVSTNTPSAVTNAAPGKTSLSVQVPDTNNPVEREFLKIEAEDDAAVEAVEKLSDAAGAAGMAGDPQAQLSLRIHMREHLDPVKKEYEDLLRLHPDYVRARLAYGSFLNQTGDEEGARVEWEKASELAPNNPAVWNNLADCYEESNVKKAFEYYSKAIELDPGQPLYYHNLAVCVYMFRTDAQDYWKISEQQVFDKSLELYRKAMKLDPDNFILASDYAGSFYGIRPPRLEDALAAWKQCLKIAHDEMEREGVYIHLARLQLQLNHFTESQRALEAVTNKMYSGLKDKITHNLAEAIQQVQSSGPPQPVR